MTKRNPGVYQRASDHMWIADHATAGCRCCGCDMDDHNDPRQGGGCTNCGECEGWL